MNRVILTAFGLLALHGVSRAEDDILLLRPEERLAVEKQTKEFQDSISPILREAADSTVRIWAGKRRLAYGTVIGDGRKILTKWSEVARASDNLVVEGSSGKAMPAVVAGVYEDNDLAVLETKGTALTPVRWEKSIPALGSFLAAPQPNGRLAAFGVLSVAERNLRETDSAFLGVLGAADFDGPGVLVDEVTKGSGAAAAGIRKGDVILKVDDRTISGALELRNSLVGREPGTGVTLRVKARDGEKNVEVTLGNRPEMPSYPGQRLNMMEQMGGPISRVRTSFTSALQSDMKPRPEQIGGPVTDLKGRVIGITLARADRTRSFIMPAAAVEKLLLTPPGDPSLAKVRQDERVASLPVRGAGRQRQVPAPEARSAERLREHLSQMEELMEFMREEMDKLEPQP